MTAAGSAWRRKFKIEPTASDLSGVVAENVRLKALVHAKDAKIETQAKELRSAKAHESEMSRTITYMNDNLAERVEERCAELSMKAERAEVMCTDLRAIIETHNAANGAELRQAMAAERDEAVRLLRVARAAESEARQEAWDTRQFLSAAQQIVGEFKDRLQALEDALGEKIEPERYYQS